MYISPSRVVFIVEAEIHNQVQANRRKDDDQIKTGVNYAVSIRSYQVFTSINEEVTPMS